MRKLILLVIFMIMISTATSAASPLQHKPDNRPDNKDDDHNGGDKAKNNTSLELFHTLTGTTTVVHINLFVIKYDDHIDCWAYYSYVGTGTLGTNQDLALKLAPITPLPNPVNLKDIAKTFIDPARAAADSNLITAAALASAKARQASAASSAATAAAAAAKKKKP